MIIEYSNPSSSRYRVATVPVQPWTEISFGEGCHFLVGHFEHNNRHQEEHLPWSLPSSTTSNSFPILNITTSQSHRVRFRMLGLLHRNRCFRPFPSIKEVLDDLWNATINLTNRPFYGRARFPTSPFSLLKFLLLPSSFEHRLLLPFPCSLLLVRHTLTHTIH